MSPEGSQSKIKLIAAECSFFSHSKAKLTILYSLGSTLKKHFLIQTNGHLMFLISLFYPQLQSLSNRCWEEETKAVPPLPPPQTGSSTPAPACRRRRRLGQ